MNIGATPSTNVCTYCSRECKTTDSRPYPSFKSQERIHNKCHLKMVVSGKKASEVGGENVKKTQPINSHMIKFNDASVADRLAKDELELKRTSKASKNHKPENNSPQFFFDLKAGTVTGEKPRYLRHSKLTDFVARYDQDGFKQEDIGRSYDASGNDLTVLQDEADLALEERLPSAAKLTLNNQTSLKRKHASVSGRKDGTAHEKRLASQKQKCWFCLSSSGADKELVIGLGKHCYLALAKGGLTDDHLLIVPLQHIPSIRSESNSQELLQELEYFKKCLVEFHGKHSKALVFYERNVKSFHWQLQVIPIPVDKFESIEGKIRRISLKHYKETNYAPSTSNQYSLQDTIPTENTPYFSWESRSITSSFECIKLTTLIDPNDEDFPIQFGRLVLADEEILNCPQKVDWKTCDRCCQDYEKLVRLLKESLGHLFDQ